ncbi:MAG: hypothetical protein U0X20_00200 [Caldilineaceae bacterium]
MNFEESSATPRPLERVVLAKESAYEHLSEQLVKAAGFEHEHATTLARCFVDPTAARNMLQRPLLKRFPGGTARIIETLIYTPAISASPINPRESEQRVYPVATPLGEQVIAPLKVEPVPGPAPVIRLIADNRAHVEDILNQSQMYLGQEVGLRDELRLDGVLEPLTIVLAEVVHRDGTGPVTIPIAVDGSTRATHCHDLAGLSPIEVMYKWSQADNRAWRGMLNQRLSVQDSSLEDATEGELAAHRVMIAPARIIIGIEPVRDSEPADVVAACRAIVGQIHVGHPKEWPQGAQNDEIAEAVLDRLVRDGKIGPQKRDYLAGSIRRNEIAQLGFSEHADVRAAHIAHVLYDSRNEGSVSSGFRSLVAKQKLSGKDKPAIVAELILRGYRTSIKPNDVGNVRLTLQRTINLPEWRNTGGWQVRRHSPDDLLQEALLELRSNPGALGPACLELGMLGTYWLVSKRALKSDSRDSDDRRAGASVVDTMMRCERGIRQLHRAIVDGRSDIQGDGPIYAVGHDSSLVALAGGGYAVVNDSWLRKTFGNVDPDPGEDNGESDVTKLNRGIQRLRYQVDEMINTVSGIAPIAQREGVAKLIADEISAKLRKIDEAVVLWGLYAQSKRGLPAAFNFDGQTDGTEPVANEVGAA